VTARGVGVVIRTLGDAVFAAVPLARVGDSARIHASGGTTVSGEVVAVERRRVAIATFGPTRGIAVGDRVESVPEGLEFVFGFGALGRAFCADGTALDGKGPLRGSRAPLFPRAARIVARAARETPFWTGVRAIDALATLARGARIGIFGVAGSGKSTLLETIARGAHSDAVVIALVGERGREAAAWLAHVDRRTTLVCATGERSAAERLRAADVALAQAVTLRARGLHVTLILDSLARYAAALREQRVALGEPVGRGGYPGTVWLELARFLESAGSAAGGSITLMATVLAEEGDEREPLGEAARSLLDGHLVLSAAAARAGRFPALDPLASTSRTMPAVAGPEHLAAAAAVRAALDRLAQCRELRGLGLLDASDAKLARAIRNEAELEAFLRQAGPVAPSEALRDLCALAQRLGPP